MTADGQDSMSGPSGVAPGCVKTGVYQEKGGVGPELAKRRGWLLLQQRLHDGEQEDRRRHVRDCGREEEAEHHHLVDQWDPLGWVRVL